MRDDTGAFTILGDSNGTSSVVVARMPHEYRENHAVWSKMMADAKLIALAPDMLRLLECLTGYVEARWKDGAAPREHAKEARELIQSIHYGGDND